MKNGLISLKEFLKNSILINNVIKTLQNENIIIIFIELKFYLNNNNIFKYYNSLINYH
jgi:hypothetical protein